MKKVRMYVASVAEVLAVAKVEFGGVGLRLREIEKSAGD